VSRLHETKRILDPWLRRMGWEFNRYPGRNPAHRRNLILQSLAAELVIDVGANTGQYGLELRDYGFQGDILSFEPLEDAFSELQKRVAKDHRWEARQTAVGDRSGTIDFHVAGNSVSSSALKMLSRHEQVVPQSATIRTVTVPVGQLDSLINVPDSRRSFLKIDTQGYEARVLDGATEALAQFDGIEMELTLTPLYAGQSLMPELVARLASTGFRLASLSSGFCDHRTGEVLQVDGIFLRA